MEGTSFRVTSSRCRSVKVSMVSATLESLSLLYDGADRDCSLRNLGAFKESIGRSDWRVSSAWFLRLVRGFFAKKPRSVRVMLLSIEASILGGGAPTSNITWLGQLERRFSL